MWQLPLKWIDFHPKPPVLIWIFPVYEPHCGKCGLPQSIRHHQRMKVWTGFHTFIFADEGFSSSLRPYSTNAFNNLSRYILYHITLWRSCFFSSDITWAWSIGGSLLYELNMLSSPPAEGAHSPFLRRRRSSCVSDYLCHQNLKSHSALYCIMSPTLELDSS